MSELFGIGSFLSQHLCSPFARSALAGAAGAGCRFSLLSRMRLLTLKDLSVTRPAEFCFIEYNFSFISRVRGPHSVSEKHRHILDST
jgi:hypothetical protein